MFRKKIVEVDYVPELKELVKQVHLLVVVFKQFIPKPINEDDWVEIVGRDEPDEINNLSDIELPPDWNRRKKPF